MKVLVLNDLVSQKPDELYLLRNICDGIGPPHEIMWVNIRDLDMCPCKKCHKCRPCGECVLPEDDAHKIGRILFSADALVIGLDTTKNTPSSPFRTLLDRCDAAITFQNRQGEISPWRKGRPATVVPVEGADNTAPAPRIDVDHYPLLQTLKAGGFKMMDVLTPEAILMGTALS